MPERPNYWSNRVLRAVSLTCGFVAAGCGGGGGSAPPEILDLNPPVLLASRTVEPFRFRAVDRDSTLVYYSASFRPSNSQTSFEGMVPGLKLNSLTGEVTGIPLSADRYTVILRATDIDGASSERSFQFEVISDSLDAVVQTRTDAGQKITEMIFSAKDTSAAGTTAYCIKRGVIQPVPSDSCFSSGSGARTLTVPVISGQPVERYYLFTRNASGAVLSSSAAPSAPFTPEIWDAAQRSLLSVVGVQTSVGAFALEIETGKTPLTASNFLQYVDERFFDSTVFHRIAAQFVIQGGGFVYDAAASPAYRQKGISDGLRASIALERTSLSGLSNGRGSIAMARGAPADSASSQFFINVTDNSRMLDSSGTSDPGKGYAVFGRLIPDASDTKTAFPAAIAALLNTPTTAIGTLGTPNEPSLPIGDPPAIQFMLRIR